jgi:uncharacterized protein YdaU (DUF1376 family)
MNYYPHHIGDFNNATRHLTRIERSVYRDLIDLYYDTEQPLTLNFPALCRKVLARTDEESTAVEQVLNEFFTKTDQGWYHDRCEEVMEEYRTNISAKSAAGKASAAKREAERLSKLNGCSTAVQQPFNEAVSSVQLTNNQEPITKEEKNKKETALASVKKKIHPLADYLAACKADGVKPLPDDDAVFEYAREAGIGLEFLKLQWLEFKDRYSPADAKQYKNWRSVFGKSVRGNWFKLWFIGNDGGYSLSTIGQQAQKVHRERK